MNDKNILYEKKGSVCKVIINRPNVLNAVDHRTIGEMKEVFAQLEKDPQVKVIIITGSGEKSFIVGADKKEIHQRNENEEEAERFETCCRETFSLLEKMGKPTLCAIHGYAFGLGLQLALACTFRIVSSSATLW